MQRMVCCVWDSAPTFDSGRFFVSILRLGLDGLSRVVVKDPTEKGALF